MALRGQDRMRIISHNATYGPPALIPGYGGHVPHIKFVSGETFGNGTNRYLQEYRRGIVSGSKNLTGYIGRFPSVGHNDIITPRAHAHSLAVSGAYWAGLNVDYDRQMELKTFGQLSQKHRERYKDRTGTKKLVTHFIIPVKEIDKYQQEQHPQILLSPLKERHSHGVSGVRRFQTLPSGIRTTLDDHMMRDLFFPRT